MMEREKTALITPRSTVSILEEKGTILNLEAPTEATKSFMETIIQYRISQLLSSILGNCGAQCLVEFGIVALT